MLSWEKLEHLPLWLPMRCSAGSSCAFVIDLLGVRGEERFTADVFCRWVMGRSANDYKLSTIELGLHAIADWLPDSRMLANVDVVRALGAAARRPSAVRRQKQPILLSILRHACSWCLACLPIGVRHEILLGGC